MGFYQKIIEIYLEQKNPTKSVYKWEKRCAEVDETKENLYLHVSFLFSIGYE